VVPDGQALAKAREIAERIAKNGPLAVKAIVATLRQTETLPEEDAFAIEQKYGMEVMASEDRRKALEHSSRSARRCSRVDSKLTGCCSPDDAPHLISDTDNPALHMPTCDVFFP